MPLTQLRRPQIKQWLADHLAVAEEQVTVDVEQFEPGEVPAKQTRAIVGVKVSPTYYVGDITKDELDIAMVQMTDSSGPKINKKPVLKVEGESESILESFVQRLAVSRFLFLFP